MTFFYVEREDGSAPAEAEGIRAARFAARTLIEEGQAERLAIRAEGERFAVETVDRNDHGEIVFHGSNASRHYEQEGSIR